MKNPAYRFQVSFNYSEFTVPTPELAALSSEIEESTATTDEPYRDSDGYQDEEPTDKQTGEAPKLDTTHMSINEIIFAKTGYHRPTKKTPKKPVTTAATPKLIEAFKTLCKKERRTTTNALHRLMVLAVENGMLELKERPAGDPYRWE